MAILHGVRAQDGQGSLDLAHAWLRRAAAGGITDGPGAGLWFGAPAVAFAIAASAPGHYPEASLTLKSAHRRHDQGTPARCPRTHRCRCPPAAGGVRPRPRPDRARRLPPAQRPRSRAAGAGAALPGPPHRARARRRRGRACGAGLVEQQQPQPHDQHPRRSRQLRHGTWHFGPFSHCLPWLPATGSPCRARQTLSTGSATWLDAWRQPGPAGPWWPTWITIAELREGRPSRAGPGRPSWCYGTPGIARALQLAALARCDKPRQAEAEDALARCVTDPAQTALLTGPGLCHGWAGTTAATWHAARDSGDAALSAAAGALAGPLASSASGDHPYGLIDGYAGAALTLHDLATQAAGTWTRCLLLT